MNELIRTLLGIIRLREGPQDLPVSWPVAILLLAMSVVLSAQLGSLLKETSPTTTTLAGTTLNLIAVIVMLQFRGYPERLPQTLSALCGANVIFGIAFIVLLPMADPQQNQPILFMLSLGVFVWSIVVDAHVYRHALSITMAQGMLIAVLLLAASYVMVEFLFMTGKAQG